MAMEALENLIRDPRSWSHLQLHGTFGLDLELHWEILSRSLGQRSKVILNGPSDGLDVSHKRLCTHTRLEVTLLKLLSPILPHLVMSPNVDLSGVSRDPQEAQKLLDDPLTDPRGSPRLAVETLSALEWTQAHAADLQVPLLLIHGDADPITPAEGSLAFFKNVKIEDKVLKLYEGGYHQAFIDSNREQVLADVAEWLDRMHETESGWPIRRTKNGSPLTKLQSA